MTTKYDEKMQRRMIQLLLPALHELLVRRGLIDTARIDDKEYVHEVVLANFDAVYQIEAHVLVHEEFITAAKEAFASGKQQIGIVLIATAIEQVLNLFYRNALEEKGQLSEEEITEFIRASSTRHKFGILLPVIANYELNVDFQKQINGVFELRNAIVHYKAKSGSLLGESKKGSYEYIHDELARLNIDEVLKLPDILMETLEEALELLREEHPDYEVIKKLKADFAARLKDMDDDLEVVEDACPD